jgi:hypothetical protein
MTKLKDIAKCVIPTWAIRTIRYNQEHKLLTRGPVPGSTKPSILLFTVHKSASTFLVKLLSIISDQTPGLTHIDIEGYSLLAADPHEFNTHVDFVKTKKEDIFYPCGYAYGPLRSLVHVPNMKNYRICLILRDPRDVLVSYYYSMAYSHPLPADPLRRRQFVRNREKIRATDINEFARQQTDWIRNRYEPYIDELVKKNKVQPLLYEDMWMNFRNWFNRLCDEIRIPCTDELLERIEKECFRNSTRKESVNRHRRRGTPEDYKDKLDSATIDFLNKELYCLLDTLGYPR